MPEVELLSDQLLVVGMTTIDMLLEVEQWPYENSETRIVSQSIAVGGPAGRAAVAASNLGGNVRLLSMIGDDHFAKALSGLDELAAANVGWFVRRGPSQNSSVILVPGSGSRSIFWSPQPDPTEEYLSRIETEICVSKSVLVDCTNSSVLRLVRDRAREEGTVSVVDTGSYKEWASPHLRGINHVVAPFKFLDPFIRDNLPRLSKSALVDKLEAGREFFDADSFCVTNGDRGCIVATADGVTWFPAFDTETIDSCGAGDTFHGAFAWSLNQDLDLFDSYCSASWVAARKCSGIANSRMPSAVEFEQGRKEIVELSRRVSSNIPQGFITR